MKRILIIIVCFFLTKLMFAQITVSYTYDNSGNRISRKVVILKNTTNDKTYTDESKSSEVEDIFGKGKITIYPNPTKELLNIRLKDIDIEKEIILQLYDTNGKLLKTNKTKDTKTTINLSNNAAGIYILKIISGNNKAEFSVVKK